MVRAIGADHVIDYTQKDFIKSTERYDMILDNVGNHSLSACRRVLNPPGSLVMIGAKNISLLLARALHARVLSRFVSQKLGFMFAKITTEDLMILGDLISSGKITPAIDRRYKLNDASQATRYLEEGHAHGKVVITME